MMTRGRPVQLAVLLIAAVSTGLPVPLFRDSLSNGLVILTYEDHRLPTVDLELVCRSGAVHDPSGKAGLSALTASMLLRGTRTRSAAEVDDLLEFLGCQVDASADYDASSFRIKLLAEHLDQLLELAAEMVQEPAFSLGEFETEKTRALTAARRAYESPGRVAMMELNRIMFRDHPYSRPDWGDTADIAYISLDDVIEHHRAHFRPNNCFLVVVGDVRREDIVERAELRFRNWQPGPPPELDLPELKTPGRLTVKLVSRPDLSQTYVAFGHPGISMSDPEMLPTRLMSFILGGSAVASRMGQSVREQAGLAYDVRCWFDQRRHPGGFRATVQTARPREAIEKMLADIRGIHESGPTAREVEVCKNYYTGSFPLEYSSTRGKLYQTTLLELHDLGLDWLDSFPDKVSAVGLEEIAAAAKKSLHPDQYYMVVLGNVKAEELGLSSAVWLE